MAVYRFLAYDLRTNALLGELPLSDVRYGSALNQAGTFSATLPITSAMSYHMDATIPERTVIFIERDGVLLEGYIIWKRTRVSRGDVTSVSLTGASIESIFKRNRIVTNITYTATDQLTIARGIVTAMQAQSGGNVGINVGSGTSGVLCDRTYNAYERKNVGEALTQLGAVENGFDWAVDVAWSSGAPAKNLTLSYPRRGRIAGSTGIVFITGKNILAYSYDEDGARSARSVDVLGAGDGADMHIATAVRTDLIDAGYPLTAETVSLKDMADDATLSAYATSAVNARAATPTFITLEIEASDLDAGLGVWTVGDDAYIEITDRAFPRKSDGTAGLAVYRRIVDYQATVTSEGKETVNITLGELLGF